MSTFDVYALAFAAPRKGVSTPALLVTLTIAVLLAAAAINLAQLSHQRHQLQIGADAAVLAATPLLHDRPPLYLGPEGTTPDIDAPALRLAQLEAAQEQAILFAGLNRVAHRPIILEPVGSGDSNDQDLLFGFTADPAMEQLTGEPAADGSFNSLVVRASRRKAAGDLPLLWMARQVGLENLEMKVYSQAVIDQRLYGFRPLAHVSVPLVPIAVLPELSDLTMFPDAELTDLWWAKGPHDHFVVDPLTQSVDHGCDGIAEMVIRIHATGGGTPTSGVKTRQGVLVGFGPGGDTSPLAIAQYSQFGLMSDDFPGGQIAIADIQNPPLLPALYNAESEDLADICDAIHSAQPSLIGAPRILPIGAQTGSSSVGIVGFVAGTIVDCEQDSDGSLLLIVQPCLLQSPTALVGGENPRNPWIGKLLLNR